MRIARRRVLNGSQELSAPDVHACTCRSQLYGASRLLDDSVDVVHVADGRHAGAGLRSPSKSSMGSPARRPTKRKAGSMSPAEEVPPAAQALAKVRVPKICTAPSILWFVVGASSKEFCGFAR